MDTTENFRLTRQERLRGKRFVDTLFEGGRGGFVYPIRYVWKVADAEQTAALPSVLFTAPKRNHKRANARNTLKRRMREAYRLGKAPLLQALSGSGRRVHLALIYSSKESEEFKKIEDAVKKIISQIAAQLGGETAGQ